MASIAGNKFVPNLMAKLYLNPDLADVKFLFKTGDDIETVSANKSVLAAGSQVFHAMFFGSMPENGDVEIVDATPEAFREFLQLFYMSKISLKMENMEQVAALADKYDVMECLVNFASSKIQKLTIDNLCWGYQLAIITENAKLKRHCEHIICENANDIFNSRTFVRCNQNVLRHILQLDALMCDESDVFEACVRWAKFACLQLAIDETDPIMWKKQLDDCFYLIRFGTMPLDVFVKHTVSYDRLFTRDDFAHIVYKDTPKFTPNKFNLMPRIFPQWDAEKLQSCKQAEGGSAYYIQNPESVWFSTNESLLLGEFECWPLKHGANTVNLQFDVKIIEIGAQSFDAIDPLTKIIFAGTVMISANFAKVPLQRPIVIRPKKMYEIRMEATTNTSGYYHTIVKWPAEVKLNETDTIKFHQDPKKIECRGLISRLHFNQLLIDAYDKGIEDEGNTLNA